MADNNTIVFPTDFSELSLKALPWAQRMAESLGGEVHVVYVVEEPYIYSSLDMTPVSLPSPAELKAAAGQRLDQLLAKELKPLGQRVRTAALVGRPSDEIVRYAKDNKAAMIVMTTHGHSGLAHVLMGSTTEAVLRKAGCPVLSVRVD